MPFGVVTRAENASGEPVITIAQLNALMQVLRAAGISFLPADHNTEKDTDQS